MSQPTNLLERKWPLNLYLSVSVLVFMYIFIKATANIKVMGLLFVCVLSTSTWFPYIDCSNLQIDIQFGNASWCVVCLSALLIFIYLLKVLFGELLQLPVTSRNNKPIQEISMCGWITNGWYSNSLSTHGYYPRNIVAGIYNSHSIMCPYMYTSTQYKQTQYLLWV